MSSSSVKEMSDDRFAVELVDMIWDILFDTGKLDGEYLMDPLDIKEAINEMKDKNKEKIENLQLRKKEIAELVQMKCHKIEVPVPDDGITKDDLIDYILEKKNGEAENGEKKDKK